MKNNFAINRFYILEISLDMVKLLCDIKTV
jgi:hypothetical protein